MIVKELFALLGFKVDDQGLSEFNGKLAEAGAKAGELSLVIAGAATALFGLAVHTAHVAEEFDKMSQKTGIGAEELQGLAFAAKMSDVEAENLSMSLNFLNRSIFAAKNGSKEAMKSFQLLGGNVSGLVARGAPTIEVFKSIADRFQQIKDPAKAAAIATSLFGRAGVQLIPFLKKGGQSIAELTEQAENLGLVLNEEVIKASNEFNDNLKITKSILTGFKNTVGATLIQAMLPAIESLNQWFISNAKLIKQGLNEFVTDLGQSIKMTWGYFKNIFTLVTRLLEPFGGLINVVKNLVSLFIIYKNLQFAKALGEAAISAVKMVMGINKAKIAMALLNAQAMLIPVLIGAAIIGLLLLFEDIAVYLDGGDSFIGVLFQKIPELLSFLKTSFGPVFEPIVALFNGLKDGTLSWVDALKLVGTTVVNFLLTPFRAVASLIGNLTALAARYSGDKGLANKAALINDFAGSMSLATPSTSPVVGAGGSSTNQSNQVTQNITNNFGQVDDPAAISSKVGDATSTGLDEVLRFSGRNLQRGRAY